MNESHDHGEHLGLSTEEAVKRLYEEIERELRDCSCEIHGKNGFWLWMRECLNHNSEYSTFRWPSLLLVLISVVVFVIAYSDRKEETLLVQCLFLFFCMLLNTLICGLETRFRHEEVHKKARFYAQQIKNDLMNNVCAIREWKSGEHYPLLHLPQSPCISLQWTFRDNRHINLPSPLIVKGDVILMCPGHVAPGHCRRIDTREDNSEFSSAAPLELKSGDIFAPSADCNANSFTSARLKKAVKPVKFLMLETPYISVLRLALEESFKRPPTLYDKERHAIIAKYMERVIIPLTWIIMLIVGFLHYGYLSQKHMIATTFTSKISFLLLRPTLAVLPLLPLTLPLSWLLLNLFGITRLIHCSIVRHYTCDIKNILEGSPASINNLQSLRVKQSTKELYFDDLDENSVTTSVEPSPMSFKSYLKNIKQFLFGSKDRLWRSSNVLQVLGSITTLCCVDKKGILSWPNPTADKVFFLTSSKHTSVTEQLEEFVVEGTVDGETVESAQNKEETDFPTKKSKYYSSSKVEVLDITHDPHSSYGIQFDDPDWKRFLPNLKPIGLNILLNTCNNAAQEEYTQFCDHIQCESLNNEASVPVVNKRCLCELARQMGFSSDAVTGYDYIFQISSFRHIKPEVIRQGKLAKSLNIPRLKMPFPNMNSAVIKDTFSTTYQLFSQGTGDLVLDSCTEFWNGQDLCVLTDNDRKRILDFYHRSSLTATCMAFAYVPLTSCPDRRLVNDYYIELPPDSSHLFRSQKCLKSWDLQREYQNLTKSHYLSTDSMTLLNQLNNQVFIGMVTMQYQACPDFVKMIEQLEKACIRFVHFSKENELRSRVFSEKMGLESGWNCHISLLSERSKLDHNVEAFIQNTSKGSKLSLAPEPCNLTRSQSAPSYVNIEANVKFENGACKQLPEEMKLVNDKTSITSSELSDHSKEAVNSTNPSSVKADISPSPSRNTESSNTDNSAPIAFDMSNRAKLPKGIENIRPHLENIDNVPLLVSLFTDCTPETTREMIKIMQENGEIVCVLGSTANIYNMPIFLQADAGIGIEPLYPQVCITQPAVKGSFYSQNNPSFLSPIEVATKLNSLMCSLTFQREDPVSLITLIMEARHYMMNTRNSLQFFLCCSLSLSLAQLCTSLLFLPPLFSSGHVLWIVCFILPILSFSLMGSPQDPQLMTMAMGKNLGLNKENILYFLWCYFIKFAPSVLITVGCFASMISHSCHEIENNSSLFGPCWLFLNRGMPQTNTLLPSALLVCQTFAAFLIVLYCGIFLYHLDLYIAVTFFGKKAHFSIVGGSVRLLVYL
ncbi:uncharacterized protein B4U79_14914 [Dinothrombium tinctorium]|uniref:Transmembrane protein 94 n=1 Tax=Dinothrombium tinctorium TaxID=1965070 RepID=A0A443RN10_9ACAR|nr:uncharacterized protein B4U79_14914 [Dinothrombium tinctorium]